MKTAFPQTQNPVSIRLYVNVPFDNTYEHHSLISAQFENNGNDIYAKSGTTPACESFLDRKRYSLTPNPPYYYPRYDLSDTFNFDFQNGLIGSVTLNLNAEQTNCNYMRVTCGSDVYYYFITGIKQVNFETYTLNLELDVIMTYQDEFLTGMFGVPVSTKRKHCNRYNTSLYPYCADFKNNEDGFSGIRPSKTRGSDSDIALHFKGGMKDLEDINWLYICCDYNNAKGKPQYLLKGNSHPLSMLVVPLTGIKLRDGANTTTIDPATAIANLVSDGSVHGCKISPYPPFYDEGVVVTTEGAWLTIQSSHLSHGDTGNWTYDTDFSDIRLMAGQTDYDPIAQNCFGIYNQKKGDYPFRSKTIGVPQGDDEKLGYKKTRQPDPRLLFAPFRKYVITAQYGGEFEFFPELLYGEYSMTTGSLDLESYTTAYIGDNNITTYIKPVSVTGTITGYKFYKELNIGLTANVNYNLPAGTNALDVFNSTQAQEYYQSKIASGITSGLTIAGGVGSVVVGGVLTATGGGSPAGIGMIAGGVTAIAGGVASAVNVAKSTNAKIEDLKNTPDSYNVAGSNFASDFNRVGQGLPYIIVYECANAVKESADDIFYEYGYSISRMCYFNLELTNDINKQERVDTDLFTRTIFNYIQLNEDITNKINANIPHVVKQKLSQVFNQGITLWTFFGFDALWNDNLVSATTNPDRWFMKDGLNNTEWNLLGYVE